MRISDWSSDVCSSDLLVDRVVDHLEHHVVQAGAVVDVADVHARTLADGFQAAQHGNPAGIVDGALAALLGVLVGFGHSARRSEEHTSELQSLMRISYAVFCLKQKNKTIIPNTINQMI